VRIIKPTGWIVAKDSETGFGIVYYNGSGWIENLLEALHYRTEQEAEIIAFLIGGQYNTYEKYYYDYLEELEWFEYHKE